ncbi:MAG: hypothetical protein H6930_06130 [Rhodoferax sp.]|nr:hypothetical protein [Rhodoferax sp.]
MANEPIIIPIEDQVPPDLDNLDADRHELILQAKALTYMLEDLIESGNSEGTDPNAPQGLQQKQYACIRSLRMHIAEIEALSNAIDKARVLK